MDYKDRLKIAFKGLKDGYHEFEYSLGDSFLTNIEYSEFEKGSIEVKVKLDKKPQYLAMDIELNGKVQVACDRCLDFFYIPVLYNGQLYAKFSDQADNEENEELMILSPGESEIDISHYVYESICLSLPYQRIHPNDKKGKSTCNKEMLIELNKHKIDERVEEIDPRWEKLKNINNN